MLLSPSQACSECHCWSYPNCDCVTEEFGQLTQQAMKLKQKADEIYSVICELRVVKQIAVSEEEHIHEILQQKDLLPETRSILEDDFLKAYNSKLRVERDLKEITLAIALIQQKHKAAVERMTACKNKYHPCSCRLDHLEQRKLEDLKRTTRLATLF